MRTWAPRPLATHLEAGGRRVAERQGGAGGAEPFARWATQLRSSRASTSCSAPIASAAEVALQISPRPAARLAETIQAIPMQNFASALSEAVAAEAAITSQAAVAAQVPRERRPRSVVAAPLPYPAPDVFASEVSAAVPRHQ